MILAVWWAAALLFVVLWLVLAGLVSLVLPESLADMDSTPLPVFCSLTVSLIWLRTEIFVLSSFVFE